MAKDEIRRHHHHHKKGKRKVWKYIIAFLLIFFAVDAVIIFKMYSDAKQAVDTTYKKVKHDSGRDNAKNIKEGKPFSILLLGTDTGEYGRTYRGRSDSIMVAIVNPKTETTTLASIPRDTKVAIPGHGFNNKLNAAYAYDGVSGAMSIIQSYLNVPIDHYIEMNMGGLVQLSSALGKIKVNNDLDFTNLGVHFPKGEITIDKDNILAFTRMRHEDPRGDYGRQKRQREVLAGLVKKITTVNGVMKYQDILSALSSNMKTDITFDQMKTIASKYRQADNVKQLQLQGDSQMIDGVSYEVVPQANLNKVSAQLRAALELKN